jgi:hypothetical protein
MKERLKPNSFQELAWASISLRRRRKIRTEFDHQL